MFYWELFKVIGFFELRKTRRTKLGKKTYRSILVIFKIFHCEADDEYSGVDDATIKFFYDKLLQNMPTWYQDEEKERFTPEHLMAAYQVMEEDVNGVAKKERIEKELRDMRFPMPDITTTLHILERPINSKKDERRPFDFQNNIYDSRHQTYFNNILRLPDKRNEEPLPPSIHRLINKHNDLIFIVGKAGIGKSELVRRVAVHCYDDPEKYKLKSLFINLERMQNQDEACFEYLIPNLADIRNKTSDPTTIARNLKYVINNQNEFVLVIDHIELIEHLLETNPKPAKYTESISKHRLVSLIMTRKWLPNARIVVAMRPGALFTISSDFPPNQVIHMGEIDHRHVRAIMVWKCYRNGMGELHFADKILMKLCNNCINVIYKMCTDVVPMLYAFEIQRKLATLDNLDVWDEVHRYEDMWKLVSRCADHRRHFFATKAMISKDKDRKHMVEMALKGRPHLNVDRSRIAEKQFSKSEVKEVVHLAVEDDRDREKESEDEGKKQIALYCCKENYFASLYCMETMRLHDFKTFIKTELLPRVKQEKYDELLDKYKACSDLRMALISYITENNSKLYHDKQFCTKRDEFLVLMGQQIISTLPGPKQTEVTLLLMKELMDLKDQTLLTVMKSMFFLTNKFEFFNADLQQPGLRAGLIYFIANYANDLQNFRLTCTGFCTNELEELTSAIANLKGRIGSLELSDVGSFTEKMKLNIAIIKPRVRVKCSIGFTIVLQEEQKVEGSLVTVSDF